MHVLRAPCLQAFLLQLLQDMFPEGQGKPNSKAKLSAVVPMVNVLFVNAKAAVSTFFTARKYDPKRPAYTKEKLGYALDQYEAIAFVTTRVMGYPLLEPEGEEVWAFAKRCNNLLTLRVVHRQWATSMTVCSGRLTAGRCRSVVCVGAAPPLWCALHPRVVYIDGTHGGQRNGQRQWHWRLWRRHRARHPHPDSRCALTSTMVYVCMYVDRHVYKAHTNIFATRSHA